MTICYLGIGSNLGDRRASIRKALGAIGELKGTKILKVSRLIETKPEGGPRGQPDYLNGAVKLRTVLPPRELLLKLQGIERALGRTKAARNGPRVIDLDILLYGDAVIAGRGLVIPHPRMFERSFVLEPLSEVL